MEDLFAKIRAEIDRDEQLALAAATYGPTWRYSDGGGGIYPSDESNHPGMIATGAYGDLNEEYGEHMVRHDPARVLRQVAAHRMILELHQPSDRDPRECTTCGDFGDCGCARGTPGWPCPTVRWVADIYGIEVPDHG